MQHLWSIKMWNHQLAYLVGHEKMLIICYSYWLKNTYCASKLLTCGHIISQMILTMSKPKELHHFIFKVTMCFIWWPVAVTSKRVGEWGRKPVNVTHTLTRLGTHVRFSSAVAFFSQWREQIPSSHATCMSWLIFLEGALVAQITYCAFNLFLISVHCIAKMLLFLSISPLSSHSLSSLHPFLLNTVKLHWAMQWQREPSWFHSYSI